MKTEPKHNPPVKTEINSSSIQGGIRNADHSLLSFQRLQAPEINIIEQMNSDNRKSLFIPQKSVPFNAFIMIFSHSDI